MPDVLIRGIKPETMERLKARAKENGRSVQAEVKLILYAAAKEAEWEERLIALGLRAPDGSPLAQPLSAGRDGTQPSPAPVREGE